MSIIYEALKKIEKKDDKYKPPFSKHFFKHIFVTVAVIGLFSFIIFSIFFPLKTNNKQIGTNSTSENEEVSLPKEQNNKIKIFSLQRGLVKGKEKQAQFHLQGLIYDKEDSIALINGKSVSIGEEIEGARLLDVSEDGIELETKKGKIYIPLDY